MIYVYNYKLTILFRYVLWEKFDKSSFDEKLMYFAPILSETSSI